MAAMRFEQVHRFILAKKYFGVRGTLISSPICFCLSHKGVVLFSPFDWLARKWLAKYFLPAVAG